MTPSEFKSNRLALNLTQNQLADKLGLSPKYGDDYIRGIEKGRKTPSGALLKSFERLIKERELLSIIAGYQAQIATLKYKLNNNGK